MPVSKAIACVLLFLSGAAALGYQMVWTRMFATGIGHETPAMLAIVCAFMAGSAAGAWALDRRIASAARPLRVYGVLECIIGAWSLGSVWMLPTVSDAAIRMIGISPGPLTHWLVAFLLPCVVLLPSTFAMGATFPAMERVVAAMQPNQRGVGLVYASNTFGAVAGVVVSTFLIAPRVGFSSTIVALAVLNIASGAWALLLRESSQAVAVPSMTPPAPPGRTRLLATLFATGLAGIGFEAAATRVLAQVLENTIFSFAAVLSVYLLGTAAGAAIYQRFFTRQSHKLLPALLGITGAACGLGILALAAIQPISDFARASRSGVLPMIGAEAIVAAAVFGAATIAMGALFSHLVQSHRRAVGRVGIAVAVNTLGAAVAPPLFGVLLFAIIGAKWTLFACALLYFAVLPRFTRVAAVSAVLVAIAAGIVPPRLHVVTIPPGGKLTQFREGVMAAVAVVEDARGDRVLRVNNRFQMGGTAAADAEYRGAHLPLLLHPAPRHVVFLGLGTGITAAGALLYPGIHIDGVELVPEVLDVLPEFAPYNRSLQVQPGVRLYAADARRFVRATTNRYDVIVADLFHPARDGAGSLYTIEHFEAMRDKLAPGGLVCQWLPLHQLDNTTLPLVVRSFRHVFPHTEGFLLRFNVDVPVLGLIGRMTPPRYSATQVESRLDAEPLAAELKRLALGDSLRLLGQYIDLAQFSSDGPLNRDDFPLVTFRAPREAYAGRSAPYTRLEPLLTEAIPAIDAPAPFVERLRSFIQARNVYLNGLIAEAEGQHDTALQRYVESARLSADFTAGYAHCLTIASVLAKTQPAKARALLQALAEAQPSRPVARQMLDRLERGN